jgi:deoxyribodipyrimidine photo-lyase
VNELYWFRNDLRLDDNPALQAHARGDTLLCVYCWPRSRPWCNVSGMGGQRERFLLESLAQLQCDLRACGQELLVLREPPELCLPRLVAVYDIGRVGVARTPGVFERAEVDELARTAGVPVRMHDSNTLFGDADLPFPVDRIPRQYTPFRKAVESLPLPAPIDAPALPPPPPGLPRQKIASVDSLPHPAFVVRGGTASGMERLQRWLFDQRAVGHYRDTRNALEGLYFSSQLSPWLANGGLSARRVAGQLRHYEAHQGVDASTVCFYRELLWREFFHWRARVDGAGLFRLRGLRGRRLLKTFDPRQFARWCAGQTNYPLVNALMHQLVATGWMSNRGRQLAASCLVNELNLDWRYGAAFFEKHLLDHDVACNYGNWQYIAGVGTDPRGGRHFSLARQAARYDPEGEFVQRWQGHCEPQPEFDVDAADWPIATAGTPRQNGDS